MVPLSQIIKELEQLAPPSHAEDYDNVGLLSGDKGWLVDKILITLDCTEAVVEDAIAQGCQLIVAHHPILFRGVKSLANQNYITRTLIKAIKNDIAIYSIHTNLDAQIHGVNRKLALKIGLIPETLTILMPKKETLHRLTVYTPKEFAAAISGALHAIGVGSIGNYEHCSFTYEGSGTYRPKPLASPYKGTIGQIETAQEVAIDYLVPSHLSKKAIEVAKSVHPYEEVAYFLQPLSNENQEIGHGMIGELTHELDVYHWLDHVKAVLGTGALRHTEIRKQTIKRVAVGGGTCSFLTKPAIAAGADVLLTSDIKYHEAFDAEGQIILVDAGHYETEQYTGEIIYEFLMRKFPNIAAVFTKVNTNPIRYY